MTLKEKIESFAKCFGSKPELFDDSDEMLAYCFDGLIIGKLKEGNYFLDSIVHIPGSYWDPPVDDYKTEIVSADLCEVLKKAGEIITERAIQNLLEDEELEESRGIENV